MSTIKKENEKFQNNLKFSAKNKFNKIYNINNNSSIPNVSISNCNSGLSLIKDIKNIPGKNNFYFYLFLYYFII